MSERHFQLVLVAQPVTCSLPARIQCLTRHKPLKLFFFGLHEANLYNFFEMAIGDFSLNSELFLHTAKNQLFCGRDLKMLKRICILILNPFVFVILT